MECPLYQVDAFTARLFAGNPAAVVLLDTWLPDETLLAVAAENNLSETAFLVPEGDLWDLRWFTPTIEVELCGHATLASASVLFEEGLVRGETVRFRSRSGPLAVRRREDLLELDFPSRPPRPAEVTEELTAALGARPIEAHAAQYLLALFRSEGEVRDLAPDFGRLADLDAFAVMATAAGEEVDFVSRFFAPRAGVPEDPVTGSAHCTLTPFWAERLGRPRLRARQLSRRGGELRCEAAGDRVLIAGRAVLYLRGTIRVPEVP